MKLNSNILTTLQILSDSTKPLRAKDLPCSSSELKCLVQAGQVMVTGRKRGTRYTTLHQAMNMLFGACSGSEGLSKVELVEKSGLSRELVDRVTALMVSVGLLTATGKTRGTRYSCAKGRLRAPKTTLALTA